VEQTSAIAIAGHGVDEARRHGSDGGQRRRRSGASPVSRSNVKTTA